MKKLLLITLLAATACYPQYNLDADLAYDCRQLEYEPFDYQEECDYGVMYYDQRDCSWYVNCPTIISF